MNRVISNSDDGTRTYTPKRFNFETPGVRFAYIAEPNQYFDICETEHKADGIIVHTFSSTGARKLWELNELVDKRNAGEIDFITDKNLLQSRAFLDNVSNTLGPSPEQTFAFHLTVRLCQLVDSRIAIAVGQGGHLSVRRACLDIINELTNNQGQLGQLDGQDDLVLSVDRKPGVASVPSLASFKNWYKACRDGKFTELVPYLSRAQSVPITSAFRHARLVAVFYDIVEDAKRTETPIDYPHQVELLNELNEQRHDETRLLELQFVLAEASMPKGLRSRRQTLLVDWDRSRSLCVAIGTGGDVFYRPCGTKSEYNEILERVLRPPDGDTQNHPRRANKPYYSQADLSDIAKRIEFRPKAYEEALDAALAAGPMPNLTKASFYRHLDRLPDYERGQLHMSNREHKRAFGIQFGHNRSGAVDSEWQGDGTPLNLICVDDQLCLPLGRLYSYKVVESISGYRLGAALGFGGESVAILAAALRMALSSGSANLAFAQRLGLEHEVLGGRKPGIFCHDHGAAFMSLHISLALINLGIASRLAPKGDPKHRSEVEGAMKDDGIVHHRLEGTTSWSPEWLKDFNYDPVKDAFVRLSDLKLHYFRNTFDVFNHKPVKSLQQRTRHQYYAAGRESLGENYDAAPPEELLEVFLSHYYTGLAFFQGGVWIEGIPYQVDSENETYKRFLGARDLVFTRSPYDLEVAYLVDGFNLTYHTLRVRPDYYEAVEGLDLWQFKAIQRATTPSSESVSDAHLEALLTERQIRRDTRRDSLLAETRSGSFDPREFRDDEPGSLGEVITVSSPDARGLTIVTPAGDDLSVWGKTPAPDATDPGIDDLIAEDLDAQQEAIAPSWSLGGKVRQRGVS